MTPRLLSCTTARPVQRALRALRPCRGPVPWVRDSSPPHPPDTKIPTRYYCCRALPDSSVAAHTLAHWEIGRVPHCAALLSTATRSRYCARRSSRLAGAPPATLLSLRTAAAVASSRAILWRRGQRAKGRANRAEHCRSLLQPVNKELLFRVSSGVPTRLSRAGQIPWPWLGGAVPLCLPSHLC